MPNVVKFSGGTLPNVISKDDWNVGINGGFGPTETTGFWNGITPPTDGYVIYKNKETQGPSIHVANNDTELISVLQNYGGTGSSVSDVLNWVNSQNDIMVLNFDYPSLETQNLKLHLNAGSTLSYDRGGNIWRDISGNGNHATINGSISFSLGSFGRFVFSGTPGDYIQISTPILLSNTSDWTLEIIFASETTTTDDQYFNIAGNSSGFTFEDISNIVFNRYDNLIFRDLIFTSIIDTTISPACDLTKEFNHISIVGHSNGTIEVYNNGTQCTLSNNVMSGTCTIDLFGAEVSDGALSFAGSISMISYYDKALTSTEVVNNYNSFSSLVVA